VESRRQFPLDRNRPTSGLQILVFDEPLGGVVELLNVLGRRQGEVVDGAVAAQSHRDYFKLGPGDLVLGLVFVKVV
jgi:hypothetical protein